MDPLRYPIGIFEAAQNPTSVQRDSWIQEIGELPALLRETVHPLSLERLQTPYRPGGWTVQQVVHHMADNDMNAYIRFKRALTEPHPVASTYQEQLWAELADYRLPIEPSLVLMEAVHARFTALLRTLQPIDFQRTLVSPTHGPLSLNAALQRYAWHNRHHTAQIQSLKTRMGWD